MSGYSEAVDFAYSHYSFVQIQDDPKRSENITVNVFKSEVDKGFSGFLLYKIQKQFQRLFVCAYGVFATFPLFRQGDEEKIVN